MLTDIVQAHECFYSQFFSALDNPILTIPYKQSTLNIPGRYFKRSAQNRVEDISENYPILSIQDFQPEVVSEFYNAYEPDRDYDLIEGETVVTTPQPVPIRLTYQVSFACKDRLQGLAYETWFIKKFLSKNANAFIYNPVSVPLNDNLESTDVVGDYIGYTFENVLPPDRTDGVYETTHRFTIGPVWIAMFDEETSDVADTINYNLDVNEKPYE